MWQKDIIRQRKSKQKTQKPGITAPYISTHIKAYSLCQTVLEPKVLQYIMGYTNISITLDVYTHLGFSQIQEKMEAVQENMKIG